MVFLGVRVVRRRTPPDAVGEALLAGNRLTPETHLRLTPCDSTLPYGIGMQSGIVASWKRCLGRQSTRRGNEQGSRSPSCQSEPGCPAPPSLGMKPAMPTPCSRPHGGWLKPAASTCESSCPTRAHSARRQPTQRSLAASRTACGPTTRPLLWRPSFAVSDPDAPPLDSESLVSLLDRHGVAYVLVGGLAAVAHGASPPHSTSISCRAGRRTISTRWPVQGALTRAENEPESHANPSGAHPAPGHISVSPPPARNNA